MRPVFRDVSPRAQDYDDFRDAFNDLVSRIGMFCSYCERRIPTQLAVEHIQPKALPAYSHLEGRWENFLLACVNCNSTKSKKDVVLKHLLLPDRDNTAAAFSYTMDGDIRVRDGLTNAQRAMAKKTLSLTGLDKRASSAIDSNGNLVAIDRVAQRMEIWMIAEVSKNDLQSNQTDEFRRQIARTATGHGFFSIWMAVFENDPAVRKQLIREFKGTAADCFDSNTTSFVSPRPANGLLDAGKI
jgi:uncharacterized protein (TIGR02646 family)